MLNYDLHQHLTSINKIHRFSFGVCVYVCTCLYAHSKCIRENNQMNIKQPHIVYFVIRSMINIVYRLLIKYAAIVLIVATWRVWVTQTHINGERERARVNEWADTSSKKCIEIMRAQRRFEVLIRMGWINITAGQRIIAYKFQC